MMSQSKCWPLLVLASLPSILAVTNSSDFEREERSKISVLLVTTTFVAHQFPLFALGEELVSRGHRVAVIGPVVGGVPTVPDVPLSKGMEFYNGGTVSAEEYRGLMDSFKNNTNLLMLIYNLTKQEERTSVNFLIPLRKAVDKLDPKEWDYVVADNAAVTILHYIARKWHTDKIMMNLSPMPIVSTFAPPWPFPRGFSRLSEDMDFKERFLNALLWLPETLALSLYQSLLAYPEEEQKTDIELLAMGSVYPVLVNTVIGFEYAKPIMPLAHFLGPLLTSNPTPLSAELQQWLDKCPEGNVIYISMGTSAELTSYLAREIIEGIANQYRIVWSLRKSNQGILSDLSIDPEKVFVSGWISQLAVLQHPAVAMSVMHCGTSSVQESLYCGKPVICIPYGADQFDVAVRVKTRYGITFFAEEITREKISDAVGAIEKGPYFANVQKLAKIFRMAGGTKKAADLVEFYAEVGQEHGVPAYIKYNWSWVQYYNVDVQVVNLILLTVGGWAVLKLLKCCCRCCSCQQNKAKKKVKTN